MEKTNQLFKRANQIIDDLLKEKSAFEKEKAKIAEVKRKQDEIAQKQETHEKDLIEREAEIKPIEDVVAFKKSAEIRAKKIQDDYIIFERVKEEFEKYRRNELEKISNRQKTLNKEEQRYQRELAALKKTKEKLAEDEKNLKGKVLGNLAKQI